SLGSLSIWSLQTPVMSPAAPVGAAMSASPTNRKSVFTLHLLYEPHQIEGRCHIRRDHGPPLVEPGSYGCGSRLAAARAARSPSSAEGAWGSPRVRIL